MRNLIITTLLALAAAQTFAMPTKAELKKAQPLVVELMAPAMEKYKSAPYKEKAAAAAKVGDASAEFAKAAETEAAKFLLLKGAVSFYARGEQYDKAAETVTTLQRAIKDVPPAVIAEITGKATGSISETKAPALYALYRTAKLQVRASEEAKSLSAKLKKMQSDALQRKYAEALAVSGNWKSAYAEFAKVKNAKLQAIVKDESSGSAKNAEAGEFWWSYEPAMEGAEDFFKSHAAAFYRKALDAGEITGLKKNLIEQRIKDVKPKIAVGEASCLPTTKSTTSAMVRQDAAPTASGKAWQEKGNTAWLTLPNGEKLEFAKCPAGTVDYRVGCNDWKKFVPQRTRKVKISRPFWIMTRPLAARNFRGYSEQRQIFGDATKDDPYFYVEGRHADFESFAESITSDLKDSLPKGYIIRLPSFAEWDYAIKANSRDPNDPYSDFDNDSVNGYQKIWDWRQKKLKNASLKNKWGIHEYWREQLLDRISEENAFIKDIDRDKNTNLIYGFNVCALKWLPELAVDPLIWSESPDAVCGHRQPQFWRCLTACRQWSHVRLVIGPDLVSEWKAKHGKK